MATKMTSKRKIHCSFCDTYYLEADQYAMHLESEHGDLIPQNMSGWQFYYYQKTEYLVISLIPPLKPNVTLFKKLKIRKFVVL